MANVESHCIEISTKEHREILQRSLKTMRKKGYDDYNELVRFRAFKLFNISIFVTRYFKSSLETFLFHFFS